MRRLALLLLAACTAGEAVAPASEPGSTLTGRDAWRAQSLEAVGWTATGGTIGSTGRYTAGSTPGRYRVVYTTAEGKADTSLVAICALAGSLTLNTHAATLNVADTLQLTATVTDGCNDADTSLAVTWVSRTTSVATVASTGTQRARVTAVARGTSWVVATSGTLKDSALVCVNGLRLTVAPQTLGLQPTQTGDLTATVTNCSGTVDSTVTWVSRNTGLATVASTGDQTATVTGVAAGSVYVVAEEGGVGVKDSALVTVAAVAACTPTATHFCPGETLQTKVTAAANGTAFTFGPGTYRMQSVSPKTNQSFRGTYGTPGDVILTGDKVLTGWVASGALWYVPNQTQQVTGGVNTVCQPGRTGCSFAEELYINGVRQERVTSLSAVTSGKWYFDYAADKIYVAVNPSGKTIETSVTPFAFGGSATGVTITNITVKRYAGARPGVVVNNSCAASWTMDSLVVRENNGVAIAICTSGKIRWSRIIKSGQMGYKAQGDNGLIYGTVFDSNNTAGHGMGGSGEAGAGKAVGTDGFIFRRDTSRFNDGPGVWVDINNTKATIDTNVVHDNKWRGIFYEISYNGMIRANDVRRNGFYIPSSTVGACDGAGILVSSSPNVEVRNNTLVGNRNGICAQETDRTPQGSFGPYHLTDLNVHHNTISQLSGRAGGSTDQDPNADPYSAAANNVYANNTYTCTGVTKWRWTGNVDKTKAQWLAYLQDAGSTFSGC